MGKKPTSRLQDTYSVNEKETGLLQTVNLLGYYEKQ